MTSAATSPFLIPAALLALAAGLPAAAQQDPDSFSLPPPSPTPTATPEGPADERAGVRIPPRSVASPVPRVTAPPQPAPLRPVPLPEPGAGPRTAPTPTPTPTPTPAAPTAPAATRDAAPGPAGQPSASATGEAPAAPATLAPVTGPTRPPAPQTVDEAPSDPLGARVFGWEWLAAGAGLLALLIAGWRLWRRRRPKVLRLTAPAAVSAEAAAPQPAAVAPPDLPRIDIRLDITGATRSLMMFTLHYRLTLANRSDRAVSDLAVAVQLTSAQRGTGNAAPLAAARQLARIERIGPHQARSIAGEVQLPLAAITPVLQGAKPLFIPLVHVTLEGEGLAALTRSFVIGPPSGAEGRVHPLPLDLPPGSLSGLTARAIAAPPASPPA